MFNRKHLAQLIGDLQSLSKNEFERSKDISRESKAYQLVMAKMHIYDEAVTFLQPLHDSHRSVFTSKRLHRMATSYMLKSKAYKRESDICYRDGDDVLAATLNTRGETCEYVANRLWPLYYATIRGKISNAWHWFLNH